MRATILALTLLASAGAWAYSGRPPVGYAGAPPQSLTCAACHVPATGSPHIPNLGDGALSVVGFPPSYKIGGPVVTVTVELRDPDQARWGFLLVAVGTRMRPGGTLSLPGYPMQRYVKLIPDATAGWNYGGNTRDGTYWSYDPPDLGGPVEWNLLWKPPAEHAVGDIMVYVSAVAADGHNGPGIENFLPGPLGDDSYATSLKIKGPPPTSGDLSGDGEITWLDYFLFALQWQGP